MATQTLADFIATRKAGAQKLVSRLLITDPALPRARATLTAFDKLADLTAEELPNRIKAAAIMRDAQRRHSPAYVEADVLHDLFVALSVDLDPPQNVIDELARIEAEKNQPAAAPEPAA